ncbi:hypothetical protein SHLO109777_06370 [Shewanella loihica]|uniref:Uncharacterized protein n=1 Tax=Shewanella loihica (strain ATCC BAA-1088 / PV-4) TaxID=323850 RepID=A3QGX2_SHELP|nr:hypothetical protein [Shewanella loihica]ABO24720.1 conserved hypothetical protein [Shewanella loihica PV-4]
MDQILKNLNDPSWWFTGVFFVLVGILLTKLLFSWIPNVFRSISSKIPAYGDLLSRRLKLRMLKAVKRNRQHEVRVNWAIARYWSIATVAILYMFFAVIMFLVYPKQEVAGIKHQLVPLMLFTPMYLLQFLAILEKKITLRIIEAHIQWEKRITKSSSKDALTRAA